MTSDNTTPDRLTLAKQRARTLLQYGQVLIGFPDGREVNGFAPPESLTYEDLRLLLDAAEMPQPVTDAERKQALDEFPMGQWHLNEWNDWIAKHCETIRRALSAPAPQTVDVQALKREIHNLCDGAKFDTEVPYSAFRTKQACDETRMYNKGRNFGLFDGARIALRHIAAEYDFAKKVK